MTMTLHVQASYFTIEERQAALIGIEKKRRINKMQAEAEVVQSSSPQSVALSPVSEESATSPVRLSPFKKKSINDLPKDEIEQRKNDIKENIEKITIHKGSQAVIKSDSLKTQIKNQTSDTLDILDSLLSNNAIEALCSLKTATNLSNQEVNKVFTL